ncbi:hypothetical protein [Pseudarthrobacter sp. H2]|uniref:hypothetical protein n=1 Tax=Pseudarthrobacter sp. H2 TaxID=3418415 RepID=UPI003CFAACC5
MIHSTGLEALMGLAKRGESTQNISVHHMNATFNLLRTWMSLGSMEMIMAYWRQKPKQKRRRAAAEILKDRDARRTAALAACVTELNRRQGPGRVTHTLVAERVGVPVQYVHWKYPSIETLLAMADTTRHGDD